MPYQKHQIFWGAYKSEREDFVSLPDAQWIIRRHIGMDEEGGHFSHDPSDLGLEQSNITLILEDEKNSFWPVMSFLTPEEATELARQLLQFAAKGESEGENSSEKGEPNDR